MKLSKRMKKIRERVDKNKYYAWSEAINVLKSSEIKFVESVEAIFRLGFDTRKADQTVRGSVILPHGTGIKKCVAVFTQNEDKIEAAKAAGADWVGSELLTGKIEKGELDFDILIATPDSMRFIGPLGQILGPKGLMPNPKDGTVTDDVSVAVENAKRGQVKFRADKAGNVHCLLGKINFSEENLKENFMAFLFELKRLKPASVKGIYIRKATLSTTMGAGVPLDLASVA